MALRAREIGRKIPLVREATVLSVADRLAIDANIDCARIAVEAKGRPTILPVVRNLDLAPVDAAGIAELVARPALVLWLCHHAWRIVCKRIDGVNVERRIPVLAFARADNLPAGRNDNLAPHVLRLARQSLGGGGSICEGGSPFPIHPFKIPFPVERDGARGIEGIHHAARRKAVDFADVLVFPGLRQFWREGVAPVDDNPAVVVEGDRQPQVASVDCVGRAPTVEHRKGVTAHFEDSGGLSVPGRLRALPGLRIGSARGVAHTLPRSPHGLRAVVARGVRAPPRAARADEIIPLAVLDDRRRLGPVAGRDARPLAGVAESIGLELRDVQARVLLTRENMVDDAGGRIGVERHVAAHLSAFHERAPLLDAPRTPRHLNRFWLARTTVDWLLARVGATCPDELEGPDRALRLCDAGHRAAIALALGLEVEVHHIPRAVLRLDDFRTLEDATGLHVRKTRICRDLLGRRNLEGDTLALPRKKILRRIATDADPGLVAVGPLGLVFAVPVPRLTLAHERTAVGVNMNSVNILPYFAVDLRRKRGACK